MKSRTLVAALGLALGAALPVASYAQAGGSGSAASGSTTTGTAATTGTPSTTTAIGTTNAAGTTSPSTQSTTSTQSVGAPRAAGTMTTTTNTTGGTTQQAVTPQSSTSATPAIGVTNSSTITSGNGTTQTFATSSATTSGSGNLGADSPGVPGSNVTLAIPGQATVGGGSSDQLLLDSVLSALSSDPSLAGANIHVVVENGRVTLSGTALNGDQAARARTVAQGVAGADRVASNIAPRA